jgi:hypothetical protein
MIDASKVILDFLLSRPGLTNLVEQRIYAEVNSPPAGYTPAGTGPAICFKSRGGQIDYVRKLLMPSIQFKCYGATEVESNEVYRALFDVLDGAQTYNILFAGQETPGQILLEPDTGWIFTLVFYTIFVIDR